MVGNKLATNLGSFEYLPLVEYFHCINIVGVFHAYEGDLAERAPSNHLEYLEIISIESQTLDLFDNVLAVVEEACNGLVAFKRRVQTLIVEHQKRVDERLRAERGHARLTASFSIQLITRAQHKSLQIFLSLDRKHLPFGSGGTAQKLLQIINKYKMY